MERRYRTAESKSESL